MHQLCIALIWVQEVVLRSSNHGIGLLYWKRRHRGKVSFQFPTTNLSSQFVKEYIFNFLLMKVMSLFYSYLLWVKVFEHIIKFDLLRRKTYSKDNYKFINFNFFSIFELKT